LTVPCERDYGKYNHSAPPPPASTPKSFGPRLDRVFRENRVPIR
jgi:hypothetical protein